MKDNNTPWETAVRTLAEDFPYPPTPDITGGVRQRLAGPPSRCVRRRLVQATLALLVAVVLLAGLLVVPPVRAALVSILRAGAITIFVGEPTATATWPTPVSGAEPGSLLTPPSLETAVFGQANRTTMEEVQVQARFPLRLPPAYGQPDEVYLQEIPDLNLSGQVVAMVWRDPPLTGQERLLLYQIAVTPYGLKGASSESVRLTTVHDQTAYWIEGSHRIQLQDGQEQESYLVTNNVLIWVEDEVTYRLESELTLEEAVLVAESLETVRERK